MTQVEHSLEQNTSMSQRPFCYFCFQSIQWDDKLGESTLVIKCTTCGSIYHQEHWDGECLKCGNNYTEVIHVGHPSPPPSSEIKRPKNLNVEAIGFEKQSIRRFLLLGSLVLFLALFASLIWALIITPPLWVWMLLAIILASYIVTGIWRLSKFSGLPVHTLLNQKQNIAKVGLEYPGYLFQWRIMPAYQQLIILIVTNEGTISKNQIQDSLKELKVPLSKLELEEILEQLVRDDWLIFSEGAYWTTQINLTKIILAQIGTNAELDLIWDIQKKNSLYQETDHFLTRAGFTTYLTKFSGFRCTSEKQIWSDLPSLYVRVVLGEVVELSEFNDILEDVKKIFLDEVIQPIIILVVDHQLHISHLHQILALHTNQTCTIIPISRASMVQAIYEEREAVVLQEQIALFTGRTNLYNIRTAVTDVLSFFGRQALIANLKKSLTNGQSTVIFGVRKIGKSSLIGRLQEEITWPYAHIDLQMYTNRLQSIYSPILETWKTNIRARYSQHLDDFQSLMNEIHFDPDSEPYHFHQATKQLLKILAKLARV